MKRTLALLSLLAAVVTGIVFAAPPASPTVEQNPVWPGVANGILQITSGVPSSTTSIPTASIASGFLHLAGGDTITGPTSDSSTFTFTGTLSSTASASFTGTLTTTGPITLATYSAANSLPALNTLSFSKTISDKWFGLIDPDFVTMDVDGTNTGFFYGQLVNYYQVSNLTGNGVNMNMVPSGSPAAIWSYNTFKIPYMSVEADFASLRGTTATPASTEVIQVGFGKDGFNQSIYANYDAVGHWFYLTSVNQSGSTVTSSSVSVTSTAPHFACQVNGNYASGWWFPDNSTAPQVLVTMSTSSGAAGFSPANPALLASMSPAIISYYTGTNTTSPVVIAHWRAGYNNGTGIANIAFQHYSNQEPTVKDGHLYYFMANKGQVSLLSGGTSDDYIKSMEACLFSYDTESNKIRTVAMFATNRAGTLYGENSGDPFYDEVTNQFFYIIPSWGSGEGISGSRVKPYLYTLPVMPRGAMVLSGGVQVVTPDDGANVAEYDVAQGRDPATTNFVLAYTKKDYTANGFGPQVAGGATYSSLTQTATTSVAGIQREGTKIFPYGATTYFLTSDSNAGQLADAFTISGSTLTLTTTIASPFVSASVHPMLVPIYQANNTTVLRWMGWSLSSWNGSAFFYGGAFEAGDTTNTITGTITPSFNIHRDFNK